MKVAPIILGLCLVIGNAHAQDSLLLEAVVVAPRHSLFSVGTTPVALDSAWLTSRPGGEMITALQLAGIPVASHSPGGFTPLQNRGTHAAQNAVYWNGIPLNSPALGSLDLNWFRYQPGDQWHYVPSGQTALHGSGSAGGSLYLEQGAFGPAGATITLGLGQFDWFSTSVRLQENKGKWFGGASFTRNQATMDYPYIHPRYGELKRENAAFWLMGARHWLGYRSGRTEIEAQVWYQQHALQIPGNILQSPQNQEQEDAFWRSMVSYRYRMRSGVLLAKTAWLTEDQTYLIRQAQLLDTNTARQWFNELEYRHFKQNWTFSTGITGQQFVASGVSKENAQRNQMALFGAAQWKRSKHAVDGALRWEGTSDGLVAWSPSLGYSYSPTAQIQLRVKGQRHYRFPTLNDFYWVPGGNSQLNPEMGWQGEVGLGVKKQVADHLLIQGNLQVYAMLVNQWIQWVPTGSLGIFAPQNVKQVYSRGLELNGSMFWKRGNWWVQGTGFYRYSPAEAVQSNLANDASLNQQLLYVPFHYVVSSASIRFGRNQLDLAWRYMGTRNELVTSSSNGEVDAYQQVDLQLARMYLKNTLRIALAVDNLLDTPVEHYLNQPLPGRNIKLQITYNPKS